MRKARFCGMVLGILAASGAVPAMVARANLQGLVGQSDVIVLARVDRLEMVDGVRVVVIDVERTFKGPEAKEWALLLTSSFQCDISTAVLGERGLFFLQPYRKSAEDTLQEVGPHFPEQLAARGLGTPHGITHYGRGRMPVRVVGGEEHLTFFRDVALPPKLEALVVETPTNREPVWQWSVPSFAMLEQVRSLTTAPASR